MYVHIVYVQLSELPVRSKIKPNHYIPDYKLTVHMTA